MVGLAFLPCSLKLIQALCQEIEWMETIEEDLAVLQNAALARVVAGW